MGTRQLTVRPVSKRWFYLKGIPVLTYHGVALASIHNSKFYVPRSAFAEHLNKITKHGCDVVLAEQIACNSNATSESKPFVALTFDDGRSSDYELVFPMLLNARVSATFFINTATIGQCGHLTWAQVEEMHRSGMSIQSHGHEHTDLARLSLSELDGQLRRSKQEIEDRLDREVKLLAAPYSSMHPHLVATAKSVGYLAVCTSGGRLARWGSDTIDRVCIYADTTPQQFAGILTGSPAFFGKKACRAALLGFPKIMALRLFPGVVDAWRRRHD